MRWSLKGCLRASASRERRQVIDGIRRGTVENAVVAFEHFDTERCQACTAAASSARCLQRRVCKPSVPQRRSLSLLETGDEQSRIGPVNNRDRTAPAALPPASGDDRTVPSGMVELDRHPVGAVHLDAIDRGVDPAGAGVAHDDDAARSLSRSLKQPRLEGATPNPISSLSGSPSLQTKLRCTTSKTMASPNTPTTDASTTLRSAAPAAKTPSMSIAIQGLRGKSKHCPRTCCLR